MLYIILIFITADFHLALIYLTISQNQVKAVSIMHHCDRTNFEIVTTAYKKRNVNKLQRIESFEDLVFAQLVTELFNFYGT
jgi:hypothetical protein